MKKMSGKFVSGLLGLALLVIPIIQASIDAKEQDEHIREIVAEEVEKQKES